MKTVQEFLGNTRKFHAQNRIDEFVEPYLPYFGYACDVGANDGTFQSNTLFFEEQGWIVLCVEPNPHLVGQARQIRKLWRQVAAGSKDEERDFVPVGYFPYASGSRIDLLQTPGSLPAVKVKVLTLDRILEEAGFPRLDFLSVDAEGWEPEIMKGFTIARWQPTIICLEHYDHGINPGFADRNNPFPIDGYEVIGRREFDVVYLSKAYKPREVPPAEPTVREDP